MPSSYPAKVLLIGEYTILVGGSALAVPTYQFTAHWEQAPQTVDKRLLAFADYLAGESLHNWLDLAAFKEQLTAGWHLRSNIPTGYGLGSSGTVCAAVYDRFRRSAEEPADLRELFAQMESFFHGSSSGMDPLIIHRSVPLLVRSSGVREVRVPPLTEGQQLFLLDSGRARSTGTLVRRFRERYASEPAFRRAVDTEWLPATEAAVSAFLRGDSAALAENIRRIGTWQAIHFSEYIPDPLKPLWQAEPYTLKICGAGGGGFALGLTSDLAASHRALAPHELLVLPL